MKDAKHGGGGGGAKGGGVQAVQNQASARRPPPQTAAAAAASKIKYVSKTTLNKAAPLVHGPAAAQKTINSGLIYLKDPAAAAPGRPEPSGRVVVSRPGQASEPFKKAHPQPVVLPSSVADRRRMVVELPEEAGSAVVVTASLIRKLDLMGPPVDTVAAGAAAAGAGAAVAGAVGAHGEDAAADAPPALDDSIDATTASAPASRGRGRAPPSPPRSPSASPSPTRKRLPDDKDKDADKLAQPSLAGFLIREEGSASFRPPATLSQVRAGYLPDIYRISSPPHTHTHSLYRPPYAALK